MISGVNQYYSQLYPNAAERSIQSQDSILNTAFSSALSKAQMQSDSYLSQLQMKFGSKISVQNLEHNKDNINQIGSSTSGTGNVIIASNILEKMASDPKARQYYEKKIQGHFDTVGEANAFMGMRGRRIVSSGVIIHPNGEVTYYSSSDYTPEEKARLEKAMKEEDEAKAKKRLEEKRRLDDLSDKKTQEVFYAEKQLLRMRLSHGSNRLNSTNIVL